MSVRAAIFSVLLVLFIGHCSSEYGATRFCRLEQETSYTLTMICENVMNEEQLDDELSSLGVTGATKLIIANSSFRFLLQNTFVGTSFLDIEIVNSTLQALTNTNIAFKGLENKLEFLTVENTTFVSHWDWDHLRNLHALITVRVMKSHMMELTEDMKHIPPHVRGVHFNEVGVSWVDPEAFSHLRSLQTLTLSGNEITSLQRTMLPNPASQLMFLHLDHNRIASLPSDFFTNMPRLTVLDLEGNQFSTIDESIFFGIVARMPYINFQDNPVRCDCRLKWLTKLERAPKNVKSFCVAPRDLEGRPVASLKPNEIWC